MMQSFLHAPALSRCLHRPLQQCELIHGSSLMMSPVADFNAHLPNAVEGFFYPKDQNPITYDLGYSIVIDVRQVHRAFLSEYRLTAQEVPLLEFDPENWERPFAIARS